MNGGMQKLVERLISQGILKTKQIINAFSSIDRADFVLAEDKDRAYEDHPLITLKNQTISQPLTVAFMLELLQVKVSEKILDIGAGSGWQTALLAHLVGDTGKVYAIERIPELCEFGQVNVAKYSFIQKGIVEFICADGSQGLAEQAPFDKIIVAAAAEEIPKALKKQLKIGGVLVLPVGGHEQAIYKIEKISDNEYKEQIYPGFIFVPLVTIKE